MEDELLLQNFEMLFKARCMNPIHGRIFGTLLIHGNSLTQQELSEKTNYSIPAMSIALDDLTRVGLVSKTKLKNKRKKVYKAEGDLCIIFNKFLKNIKEQHVTPFKIILTSYKKKNRKLKEMHSQLTDLEIYLDDLLKVKIPEKSR